MNRSTNSYRFCDGDFNRLVFILFKSVYPSECVGEMKLI